MTDSIKKAPHPQPKSTKSSVDVEDWKMEKVGGGVRKPVCPPKSKLNGDSQNKGDDILLPEID